MLLKEIIKIATTTKYSTRNEPNADVCVEDLRAVMEKKLVSVEARGAVGAYVASYEDVVGEQGGDSIDKIRARAQTGA